MKKIDLKFPKHY